LAVLAAAASTHLPLWAFTRLYQALVETAALALSMLTVVIPAATTVAATPMATIRRVARGRGRRRGEKRFKASSLAEWGRRVLEETRSETDAVRRWPQSSALRIRRADVQGG
jgi:hypothetical protein